MMKGAIIILLQWKGGFSMVIIESKKSSEEDIDLKINIICGSVC